MLPRTYLLNVSIIGSVNELFQLSQAVGLGQGKDQLCFNVRLAGLLTGHLQKLDQVLPVPCTQQSTRISFMSTSIYSIFTKTLLKCLH